MHACMHMHVLHILSYQLQVCVNGILKFEESGNRYCHPQWSLPVVVPFWREHSCNSDNYCYYHVGHVNYEVHRLGEADSQNLDTINEYIQNVTGEKFMGTWMLLAEWHIRSTWVSPWQVNFLASTDNIII